MNGTLSTWRSSGRGSGRERDAHLVTGRRACAHEVFEVAASVQHGVAVDECLVVRGHVELGRVHADATRLQALQLPFEELDAGLQAHPGVPSRTTTTRSRSPRKSSGIAFMSTARNCHARAELVGRAQAVAVEIGEARRVLSGVVPGDGGVGTRGQVGREDRATLRREVRGEGFDADAEAETPPAGLDHARRPAATA